MIIAYMSERHCVGILVIKQEMISTKLACSLVSCSLLNLLKVKRLRRLKTWLRSTMTYERLTGLALMHVHRHMNFNIAEIIDNFALAYPRRMRLLNVVSSDE